MQSFGGRPEEKQSLGRLRVYEMALLELLFKKWDAGMLGTELIWLGVGTGGGRL
jgi:hypothetical protein